MKMGLWIYGLELISKWQASEETFNIKRRLLSLKESTTQYVFVHCTKVRICSDLATPAALSEIDRPLMSMLLSHSWCLNESPRQRWKSISVESRGKCSIKSKFESLAVMQTNAHDPFATERWQPTNRELQLSVPIQGWCCGTNNSSITSNIDPRSGKPTKLTKRNPRQRQGFRNAWGSVS